MMEFEHFYIVKEGEEARIYRRDDPDDELMAVITADDTGVTIAVSEEDGEEIRNKENAQSDGLSDMVYTVVQVALWVTALVIVLVVFS